MVLLVAFRIFSYDILYTKYDIRVCTEVFLDKKVYYNNIKNVSEQNNKLISQCIKSK